MADFGERPRSLLCDFDGAVSSLDEVSESFPVPLHYGNPGAEERALRAGEAVTDYSDREIVQVSGVDRLSWLENLSTQRLVGMSADDSSELLILSPQGHIENHAGVYEDGESTWLICDSGYGQAMVDFLNSMRFMLRVEVQARPDMAALAVYGDFPAEAQEAVGGGEPVRIWRDAWARTAESGAHYGVEDGNHPGCKGESMQVLLCERDRLAHIASACVAAGYRLAGSLASEAVRVRSWRPRMSFEGAREKALPHELDWLRTAVHLHKGCYRGQETVAKIVNLGRPPRRLTYLYLEGEFGELPSAGADVLWDGRVCGQITSAVRSTDEGAVALAVLRRAVPIDAILGVGEYQASQKEIVSCEGKSSVSPETRPGAELRGGITPASANNRANLA
ncbi:MAG: folate-binding protein [Actinomycetaceae bacterium]|nr:folate-binding protein [Actinomycetaceae bacterium]